jgi:hypothetical protein
MKLISAIMACICLLQACSTSKEKESSYYYDYDLANGKGIQHINVEDLSSRKDSGYFYLEAISSAQERITFIRNDYKMVVLMSRAQNSIWYEFINSLSLGEYKKRFLLYHDSIVKEYLFGPQLKNNSGPISASVTRCGGDFCDVFSGFISSKDTNNIRLKRESIEQDLSKQTMDSIRVYQKLPETLRAWFR